MSSRALAALPFLCATLLLGAGGAPFFWPLGLSIVAAASIVVPWRGSLTTFGALLWMIAGATAPVLWVRNTTTEPGLALSATLLLLGIASVRLFFANPLFGRGFDRALVGFACISEGIGVKSAAYPYLTVVLVVGFLVGDAGGLATLRTFTRTPRAAASVVLLAAGLALLVGFGMPALDRATNRRFQALFAGRMARIGFTPHVRLDQSGFISSSEDIVLRLRGAEADYLRGAVFDSFDGVYWTTSPRKRPQGVRGTGVATSRTEVDATEPSRWLFAPRGSRIVSDTAWEVDALGALRPTDRRRVTHWAFAGDPDVAENMPTDDDLGVPLALAPQLEKLARAWTAGATDDRARADAIVRHLIGDFTYTLDRPPTPPGQRALLDFLLVHRSGHCEFFASAFVMLARVLGIPSRLVAGFRVVEHNGFGGYAVVRAKHAHAWAEAYVPSMKNGAGFEVFDATPPGVPTLSETRTRSVAALLDYLRIAIGSFYDAAVAAPERSIPVLFGIVVAALIVRALRNRRRKSRDRDAPLDAPPAAFTRFEALLAENGFVRGRAETLEALAARLALGDRNALASALRRYARARYGPGAATDSDLANTLRFMS